MKLAKLLRNNTDGPFTVWFVDALENRHRIRTYESLKSAETKAQRVFCISEAEMNFGCAVHITDGRGETISAQLVQ